MMGIDIEEESKSPPKIKKQGSHRKTNSMRNQFVFNQDVVNQLSSSGLESS